MRVILLLLVFLPTLAQAQGAGGGGRFEVALASTHIGFSTSSSQFDFGPGVWFALFPWLQLGGDASYQKMSYRGGATYNWTFMVGPTFSLGPNFQDAFFASVGLVLRIGGSDFEDATTADPDGFAFYFMAGKRFVLGGPFSFRPSLGMMSSGTTAFIVRPLAVSMTF